MKKILAWLVVVVMIVSLSGCNKVENFNEKVAAILESEEITQKQLDEVFALYDAMTDKEKEKINNFDEIEKYRGVDIDATNEITDLINGISEETPFSEMLEIQEKIDNLKPTEKDLIDTTKFDEAFKLTDLEKAAVAACQTIKECLKNASSFELISVEVANDLDGETGYYLVSVEYSATNSFGGRSDSASLITINDDFESPLLSIAMALGSYDSFLNNTIYASDFFALKDKDKAVELDREKIIYYIDEEVKSK